VGQSPFRRRKLFIFQGGTSQKCPFSLSSLFYSSGSNVRCGPITSQVSLTPQSTHSKPLAQRRPAFPTDQGPYFPRGFFFCWKEGRPPREVFLATTDPLSPPHFVSGVFLNETAPYPFFRVLRGTPFPVFPGFFPPLGGRDFRAPGTWLEFPPKNLPANQTNKTVVAAPLPLAGRQAVPSRFFSQFNVTLKRRLAL